MNFDKLVENTAAKIAAYETVYGHPIALSVRVAHDINTNYNLGYDVMTWVADGYVDMVCPSPIGEITDTNMFTRLWYSLLESYDVTLAPCMGDKIKTYADTKLVAAQNAATLAGEASALLSMGADKVCVGYNTVDDASLNVLGSYSKLLATDRRVVLTYTDIAPVWQKTDAQVPKEVSGTNKAATIRIPVGDVADGSNVTLKFGFKMGSSGITGPSALSGAEVYANSKLCTFVNSEACDLGYTDAELYCFSVPVEAVNDGGYIVAEIAGVKGSLNVYSAEVVVDAN